MATVAEMDALARAIMRNPDIPRLPIEYRRLQTALGQCRFDDRGEPLRIEISTVWLPYLDSEQARDLLLHEFSHAIAGAGARHGPRWKAVARRLGARPSRTADLPASLVQSVRRTTALYRVHCSNDACASEYFRHRLSGPLKRSRRPLLCGRCRRGRLLVGRNPYRTAP